MSLAEPVLTRPGAGRTVTYGGGSSAELKLAGEQSGSDWAVVEWHLRAVDEPPIQTHTREDEIIYVLAGSITAFFADRDSQRPPHRERSVPRSLEASLPTSHMRRREPRDAQVAMTHDHGFDRQDRSTVIPSAAPCPPDRVPPLHLSRWGGPYG
jgi:hypothetical protein